eukprot:7391812-Prymnesium_polylepis.3
MCKVWCAHLLVDEGVVAEAHAVLVRAAILGLEVVVRLERRLRALELVLEVLLDDGVLAGRLLGVRLCALAQRLELLLHLPSSPVARLEPRAQVVKPRVRVRLPTERRHLALRELERHRIERRALGCPLQPQRLGLRSRLAPALQGDGVRLGGAARHDLRLRPLLLHHLKVRLVRAHALLRLLGAHRLSARRLAQPRHLRARLAAPQARDER